MAARKVKVCLGGQGADEIFGGYARYALVHPGRVVASWVRGKVRARRTARAAGGAPVGGNLGKQLLDARNFRRLLRLAPGGLTWERRYFDNFAAVAEAPWRRVIDPSLVSRRAACEQFMEVVHSTSQPDPADRVLYWDVSTYLPGLFHQEDRMSMASSLESRVPLADPRLVRFAFHVPFALKMRDGASKWILRQAVSEVLPPEVLNRRKVGFDTPVASWMQGPHESFVRDLLLSSRARSRGFWRAEGLRAAIEDRGRPDWYDRIWKLVTIETWARIFLDGELPQVPPQAP